MLVETDSLSKRYGSLVALRSCSFTIGAGEVFGLLGPNGAGKTTLLRLLLGFLRPSSGSARIAGWDCQRQSLAVRKAVSYLPGDVRLFRSMRGAAVLRFFSDVRRGASFARATAIADQLQLDLSGRVSRMSTGMRQKLALAAAFAGDTPLLILDEPTANLDPSVRRTVLRLVQRARQEGRTILFSSHVFSEAEEICDRVGIMRRGELVHVQELVELRRGHRIGARLVGPFRSPPADLERQLSVQIDGDRLSVETDSPLGPILKWLASLSLEEIRIEPVGLRSLYERFHATVASETP
ncbi:MAG: multidrug ABC transporter ATP-binding protein [Planctomycetaceae bacterium]|nr:multidrug ABC transporter ATP-binding protein [Planctomycetaceae bacterium]